MNSPSTPIRRELQTRRASPFRSSLYVAAVIASISIWLVACVAWVTVLPPRPHVEELTDLGRQFFHPDHDLKIYILAGLTAVVTSAFFLYLANVGNTSREEIAPASATGSYASHLIDLIAILATGLLVVAITPAELAEKSLAFDQFHHVDFYLMGPLQGFRHGLGLGTEIYSQYGSGWIILFEAISQLIDVDYVVLMAMLPLFCAIYFVSVYFVLKRLTNSAPWSLAGLLLCLWLQMFCGTDMPICIAPSSSVLRCPFDMSLVLALSLRTTHPRISAIAAGACGGASLLFGTDTGIYVAAALVIYSVLAAFRFRTMKVECVALKHLWGTYLFVLAVGLWWASRGTIGEGRFWSGYFESLLDYSGGFSALPVANVLTKSELGILFLLMLMIYTLSVARAFAAAARGTADDRELVLAVIGTVGFGTLLLFIGRSHPFNLFHSIVPACVLGTVKFTHWSSSLRSMMPVWHRQVARLLPVLAISGLLVALGTNENVADHPSVVGHGVRILTGKRNGSTASELPYFAEKIKAVKAQLLELDAVNRVVIVGEDPTYWLQALDRPPMGRYCPAALIKWSQVRLMVESFYSLDPQVVLEVNSPSMFGSTMKYTDASWRTIFTDPEYRIMVSPDFPDPKLGLP